MPITVEDTEKGLHQSTFHENRALDTQVSFPQFALEIGKTAKNQAMPSQDLLLQMQHPVLSITSLKSAIVHISEMKRVG